VPKKILITGAEGQLGRSLQSTLSSSFHIIPTALHPSVHAKLKRNVIKLDITNEKQCKRVMDEVSPDIIINCAAITNVDLCENDHQLARMVNVVGVENLVRSSDNNTRIIHISTDYVFSGNEGPYKENDPTHPFSYYGKSKLEGENVLRGSLHPWCIIRGSVLYGDPVNSKSNFFSWVYDSLKSSTPIKVVDDQISNPAWLELLSEFIFKCIMLNSTGVYHFGSEDYLSRYEFAQQIAKTFDLDASLISPVKTSDLSFNAPRPIHSGLSTEKISNEFDIQIQPTSFCLRSIQQKAYIL
jgi:dTDP-4-dehydrorhamnose reductase